MEQGLTIGGETIVSVRRKLGRMNKKERKVRINIHKVKQKFMINENNHVIIRAGETKYLNNKQ